MCYIEVYVTRKSIIHYMRESPAVGFFSSSECRENLSVFTMVFVRIHAELPKSIVYIYIIDFGIQSITYNGYNTII